MRTGQPATISVDALDGAMLQGVVEQIFPATGTEFSVLKTGNASGNLIKVVQRLTVKIGLERGQDAVEHIRPGMSVHTSVDTSS